LFRTLLPWKLLPVRLRFTLCLHLLNSRHGLLIKRDSQQFVRIVEF
jgi:hypothetical protein